MRSRKVFSLLRGHSSRLCQVGAVALVTLYVLHTSREHHYGPSIALVTSPPPGSDTRNAPLIISHTPPAHSQLLPIDPPVDADVWWFAPFLDHSSFGAEASGYVLSLLRENLVGGSRLHVGLLQNDCSDQQAGVMGEEDHAQLLAMRGRPSEPAIVVCHNLPPYLGRPAPRWRSCEPCPPPNSPQLVRYAVARAMAETSRVPADFVRALNSLDEVWVPTEASSAALRGSGVVRPLRQVPLGVDVRELDRRRVKPLTLPPPNAVQVFGPQGPVSCHQRPFAFLSIFKWERRKGYDVLLKAFLHEFSSERQHQQGRSQGPKEQCAGPGPSASVADGIDAAAACVDALQVELYILTKPFLSDETGAGLKERLRQWAGEELGPGFDPDRSARVYVVSGHVSRRDYVGLLAAADAFVLPTRGEGWGLPILEAMSLGLPVIATNWSGPTAYLDERVGYPLSYSLEAVPSTEPYWFQGSEWAEPSVPHLRGLMRTVTDCRGRGADTLARGAAARRRVASRYALPVVARCVAAELWRIANTTLAAGGGGGGDGGTAEGGPSAAVALVGR